MKITRFEDLKAWQRSRELFKLVSQVTSHPSLSKNYAVKDQMMRASLSVMANIAEGYDRGGDKEFIQYLYISKGSCSELRSHLYAAKDAGYLEHRNFEIAYELAEETSRILQGLISSIKASGSKGRKFVRDN
jgi:four helix bundle protein